MVISITSVNDITFTAIDRAITLFKKCTFAMDRGYDNKIFLKLLDEQQDFVIRIRKNSLQIKSQEEIAEKCEAHAG